MGQVLEPLRDYDVDSSEANGMRACFASIQGWRQTQEDDHTVCAQVPGHSELAFFAVFDGHGGSAASLFAARATLKIFAETLAKGETDHNAVSTALHNAIMATDRAMEADANGLGRQRYMHEGCTGILCVVTRTHVVCANVGDSRAILLTLGGSEGKGVEVKALSVDQKPGNQKEEQRIRAAGMTVMDCNGVNRVNGDLAVARALGDFAFKNADLAQEKQAVSCEPEMQIAPRVPGAAQVLVLACDGIWDVMDNNDAAGFVAAQLREHQEIFTTAARMVDECLDKGSRDNMSVLLVDLNSSFKLGERPVYVKPEEPTYSLDQFVSPAPAPAETADAAIPAPAPAPASAAEPATGGNDAAQPSIPAAE